MLFQLILVASFLASTLAVPTPHDSYDDHSHNVRKALPDTWYQPRDHPVHTLFKRAPGDGTNYPAVGSPEWSAGYPTNAPDPNTLPAAWVVALNAAVAAGKIPNVPQSSNVPNENPVYPNGLNPNGPTVCSATYKCRIPGDIWDSPDGIFASSFDDGPSPLTPQLVDFLGGQNDTTTHFMIGTNILYYPTQFLSAFNAGHDIAVHTWTHPYMTTLSSLQIVGELGYTMKLIHDSTGGRVPRYWRPPYGDSDMRVRSIALEVFGLQTVVWNQDSEDWAGTPASIESALTKFLALPKTPGLIILEHEIASVTVNAFITAYPQIQAAGWKFMSLAKAVNNGATYQNAQSSTSDDVVKADIILGLSSTSSMSTSSTLTPTSSSTTSSSATTGTSSPTSTTTNQNLAPTTTPTSSGAALRATRILTLCGILSTAIFLFS
ncbi:chitin deacetylase [Pholiota conissans]|uniref:chitin deacetylase n=1 Tax=Pholiota conissans TaxID=109636 RepID=A0A9P5ZDW8_9AGAR|nr:chitin deacetylase [Pholiota conissans]